MANKRPSRIPKQFKPRRIRLEPPPDLSAEQREQWLRADEMADAPQTYRHGNFFVVHDVTVHNSSVIDLNGKTFFRHTGPVEEVFLITGAMLNLRAGGGRLYARRFDSMPDALFANAGFVIMDQVLAGNPNIDLAALAATAEAMPDDDEDEVEDLQDDDDALTIDDDEDEADEAALREALRADGLDMRVLDDDYGDDGDDGDDDGDGNSWNGASETYRR
jgi:hypothetical protein